MKKYICVTCAAFLAFGATAQNVGIRGSSSFDPGTVLTARDISGKPLIVTGWGAVDGSPLLRDQWTKGYVKFNNGKYVKETPLRLNLYNNELHYQLNDITYSFVDQVKEFSFSYVEKDKQYIALYRTGYPEGKSGTGPQTFYEVLSEGPRFQLLKRNYKTIQENPGGYGGVPTRNFKDNIELYVFDQESGYLTFVKGKKLAEAVPALSGVIATKVADNKVGKFSNETDLINLFAQINQ